MSGASEEHIAALAAEIDRALPPTSVERLVSVAGLAIFYLGIAALLVFCAACVGYWLVPHDYRGTLLQVLIWTGSSALGLQVLFFTGGWLHRRMVMRRLRAAARTTLSHLSPERIAEGLCLEVDNAHRAAARERFLRDLLARD